MRQNTAAQSASDQVLEVIQNQVDTAKRQADEAKALAEEAERETDPVRKTQLARQAK